MDNVEIFIPPQDSYVPPNVLSGHFVFGTIALKGQSQGYQKLKIDPEAFSCTKNMTSSFEIANCDLSNEDFFFLKEFKMLTFFSIYSSANIHLANWKNLPSLALHSINIFHCPTLDEWDRFLSMVNQFRLRSINLYDNDIGDKTMSRILKWLLESPSSESLNFLTINKNLLTYIPSQISLFKNLKSIDISDNQLLSFCTSSIITVRSLTSVALHFNNIQFLMPGALKGWHNILRWFSYIYMQL